MTHGKPDFGQPVDMTTVQILDGGEIAARMGSIDRLDRSGTVIYLDDGNHGIEDYITGSTNKYTYQARLITGSVSGVGIESVFASGYSAALLYTLRLPMSKLSRFGFEYKFYVDNLSAANYPDFYVFYEVIHDNKYYLFSLEYDYKNVVGKVNEQIGGSPVTHIFSSASIGPSPLFYPSYPLHIKMVVNPLLEKWEYATINGYYFDFSSYVVQGDTLVQPNNIAFNVQMQSGTATGTVGFTDLIITQDEPERKE